jgi:hypothetical protein
MDGRDGSLRCRKPVFGFHVCLNFEPGLVLGDKEVENFGFVCIPRESILTALSRGLHCQLLGVGEWSGTGVKSCVFRDATMRVPV